MKYIGIFVALLMPMGALSMIVAEFSDEEGFTKVSRTFFIIGIVLLALELISLIITGVLLFL